MVDKRKRAGSDVASAAHRASEASEDEQLLHDGSAAKEQSQSKALLPFADGAELFQSLQTPSADLLRLLLSRFRNQTTLSFAENTQRSTIPASDKRIQLVKDYCQLCETQASNSSASTSAAASIFSTWELADRQDLATLLHLPIFCLAQSLALLSIHYPTHALGSSIIDRILSTNQPWLALLHNYISALGGAKFASAKQRESRSSKGSDVAGLASLVLLREISTFAKGRYASRLFDSFNWSMKVLPHIFNMRRRSGRKPKASKKSQAAHDVSLRRPDIRTLYILFLLSFLQQAYSHTLKLRLLDLGRDFLPALLKGLPHDPPDVAQTVLLHLHEDLVKDPKIPRSKKVEFWNEWACGCVVQLYAREQEHVLVHADTDAVENPSVAELAHHFLLSICTNPGFGICYPDRGWYPRKASSHATDTDAGRTDALLEGFDEADRAANARAHTGKQPSGSIYNKVLSGVLRQLAVAEDLRQQELALSILNACPELVGPYLESSCAGLSVDPRPSSRWLCNVAFFGRVVGLELPSFLNAKVEHLESDTSSTGPLVPHAHRLFTSEPPPMSIVLANVLPAPLHRHLFSQGLNSSDRLVRYSTCALLCRCLDRMVRFRDVCLNAITELDEDENGPWRRHLDALEMEARRRIPDISVVIQILQVATSRNSANGTSDAVDADEITGSARENRNMLSTEAALRLLSLYYRAVPSSAFDVRFNAGKLLTNAFMQSTRSDAPKPADEEGSANGGESTKDGSATGEEGEGDSEDKDEGEDSGEIHLDALCQVHTLRILSHSARAASFDWTAKPTGSSINMSYLGMLLALFISTPLSQVKQACEDLLRSLLAPSSLFEHDPDELDAWLASLPQADTRVSQDTMEAGPDGSAVATGHHDLSDEQQTVVSFLDECMLRCAKTPYRYIETARQFLQQYGRDSNKDEEDVGKAKLSAPADLVASPWLMVVYEQFSIRVEKGLFSAETGSVDAVTAFFVRLLPILCAYTRHTSALEVMAAKIQQQIDGNTKYSSSSFPASTLLSKMQSIHTAPSAELPQTPSRLEQATKFVSTLFDGISSPSDLTRCLRKAERPLTKPQVSELWEAARKLHQTGYALVSQILEELDPVTENVGAAAFNNAREINYGHIPVLHLPLGATFAPQIREVFMATTAGVEDKGENTLVPWKTKDQARLAIWAAINRSQCEKIQDELLPHVASLINMADASDFLSEEVSKHYLFVEAAAHIDFRAAKPRYASGLLRQLSGLAIQHLDPVRRSHRQMAQTALSKLGEDEAFNGDWYLTAINLAPFMEESRASEILNRCIHVLANAAPEAEAAILAAQLLCTIAAVFKPPARPWISIALRLQAVINAAAALEPAEGGSAHGDLLFGLIHSVLQTAQHSADPSLRKYLLELDVSQLAQSKNESPAKDGAVVAAIHAHPALALSVARSLLSILSSEADPDQLRVVQNLPCTLLTFLSALLEEASPQLAGQIVTEAHLTPIVDLGTSAVLSLSDVSPDAAQKHATCLVLAMRCAFKFGWKKTQSDMATQLSKFTREALDTLPRKAFRTSLLQVLLGLVEEVPSCPGLSDILQAAVDSALLWLVRRFAEDDNDSHGLVQTITLFTALIERIGERVQLKVQLKKSLVDPVIQAAIKNRLRALAQMQLVRALCIHAELEPAHLSRYLGALSAHSDFNAIMRGSASLQHPFNNEDNSDEEREHKPAEAEELKQLTTELVYTIASRDVRELLRTPLLTKLLAFYGASLAKSDRMLLALFRKFEEVCGQSFATLIQTWTLPSSQHVGSGGQENTLEALLSLDANVVFATCTEFPRSLSLGITLASGYEVPQEEEDALPGQVYGRHSNASQRYDPVFLSSLLAGVTARGVRLNGLQWLSVFATNVPGLVVCGLSSRCADVRGASLTLISNLYLAVREADFQEKDHLIMVLDLLRDALDASTAIQADSSPSSVPFLPTITTLFIAHALRSVTTPSGFIYPVISHFLLQRPELDVSDVPLLYNLLYTASDRYKQERMWILRFLRDVARSGGRSDWKIFKRRRTWELLASMYDACDAGSSGGASTERAVEEAAMRALIEDATAWLVRNGDVAIELVTRRGLLTWIWQQVVKEGVVALAQHADGNTVGDRAEKEEVEAHAAPASAPSLRSVWVLLLAQLVRSVDLDRLHRATEGAWVVTLTNIAHTTIKALHVCYTARSTQRSTGVAAVSAELVHTITYAVSVILEKITLFADDTLVGLQAVAIVDTLERCLDLALSQDADTRRKEAEECSVRLQRAALGLAGAGVQQERLSRLIRRSTAVCRRFDAETSSLVVSTLFAA